jgi:hypothetical protein
VVNRRPVINPPAPGADKRWLKRVAQFSQQPVPGVLGLKTSIDGVDVADERSPRLDYGCLLVIAPKSYSLALAAAWTSFPGPRDEPFGHWTDPQRISVEFDPPRPAGSRIRAKDHPGRVRLGRTHDRHRLLQRACLAQDTLLRPMPWPS